jgi:hypothetical protein
MMLIPLFTRSAFGRIVLRVGVYCTVPDSTMLTQTVFSTGMTCLGRKQLSEEFLFSLRRIDHDPFYT